MKASRASIPWYLGALCAAGWLCPHASAQPSNPTVAPDFSAADEDVDHARARALSADAMVAYRAGDFPLALARFQEAYARVPAPELLFNIGQCYRQLQRHEAAKAVFTAYLEALPNAPERTQIERWIASSEHQHAVAPTAATLPEPGASSSPSRDRSLTSASDSSERDTPALYEEWWFWTAVGVVAVGGGVTAALLLGGDDGQQAPPTGSLGTVRWN